MNLYFKIMLVGTLSSAVAYTIRCNEQAQEIFPSTMAYEHITKGLSIFESCHSCMPAKEYSMLEGHLRSALQALGPEARGCGNFFNCAAFSACANCSTFMSLAGTFKYIGISVTMIQGACFTATSAVSGTITVSFLTPFSVAPVVIPYSQLGNLLTITGVTNTGFTVTDAATSDTISFIAQQAC